MTSREHSGHTHTHTHHTYGFLLFHGALLWEPQKGSWHSGRDHGHALPVMVHGLQPGTRNTTFNLMSNTKQTGGCHDMDQKKFQRRFSLAHIYVCLRHQATAGWAWLDGGDLHVNRRRLLGVSHLLHFVCKRTGETMSGGSERRQVARRWPRCSRYRHKLVIPATRRCVSTLNCATDRHTNSENSSLGTREGTRWRTWMKCVQPRKPCKLFPGSRVSSIAGAVPSSHGLK